MAEEATDEEYDDEDTTQRGATAFAGTGAGVRSGPVGAGGGPTIRAVTLGALSVPVPKQLIVKPLEAPAAARFPWPAVLFGIALGVSATVVVGAIALHALGLLRVF